jgi:hypothetical protein
MIDKRKDQVAKLIFDWSNKQTLLWVDIKDLADQIDALYKLPDGLREKIGRTMISRAEEGFAGLKELESPEPFFLGYWQGLKDYGNYLLQQDKDCSGCEYKHVCKDDPQKPDYCPKGTGKKE